MPTGAVWKCIGNVHQLVNQFLECFIHFSSPYLVIRSLRLKEINIRSKAESVSENLINFDDVVLNVNAELVDKKCNEICLMR